MLHVVGTMITVSQASGKLLLKEYGRFVRGRFSHPERDIA